LIFLTHQLFAYFINQRLTHLKGSSPMKFQKTLITASILGLCASGSALARGTNDLHENQWHQITSYDQVSVNDDSVQNWGPWGNFVEPAAGGPLFNPAQMPGASNSDAYRILPTTQIQALQASACGTGALCGYTLFFNVRADQNGMEQTPWMPGLFSLTLSPGSPPQQPQDGPMPMMMPGTSSTASWEMTSLSNTAPSLANSGGKIPVYSPFFTPAQYFSGSTGDKGQWNYIYGGNGQYFGGVAGLYSADPDLVIGVAQRQVSNYVTGSESGPTSMAATVAIYAVGTPTTQAFMADQQTRNISASYSGTSFDGNSNGKVNINVQFGTGKWQGYWNGQTTSFQANGNVSGANITSTSVSALPYDTSATYRGTVQGTFYGQQAGAIAGVTSVTKTSTANPAFSQTQNAVYVVNKATGRE